MRSRFRPAYRTVVCALASLGALCDATAASADVTFTVDSVLDQIDDDTADGVCHTAANTCTLRAAVMQANFITGPGTIIDLPAGTYTLTRPPILPYGPDDGDLNLTTPSSGNPLIAIVGAGQDVTIIDGNQLDRVLDVEWTRFASLTQLTIRNGLMVTAGQHGGGIRNEGYLTLNRCVVSGNAAAGVSTRGGGIWSTNELFLNDSTVSGNTATEAGGGIFSSGSVVLERSSVTGNSALGAGGGILSTQELTVIGSTVNLNSSIFNGGGIYSSGPVLTIVNTTIGLNDAYQDGGGVHAVVANLYSSTIVGNGADFDADVNGGIGGGIYVDGAGPINLSNTLVAGNTLFNQPIYDDCYGTLTSYRTNLFGEVSIFCTIAVGGGDGWGLLNSLAFLGQLDKNGGPTETIALLPGSNAIDLGDSTLGCTGPVNEVLAADQRGAPRAWGVRCDVGAYEAGPLFFDGFESGDLAAW